MYLFTFICAKHYLFARGCSVWQIHHGAHKWPDLPREARRQVHREDEEDDQEVRGQLQAFIRMHGDQAQMS